MATYQDIPLAAQTLAVSQPLIRNNFSLTNTCVVRNHLSMTDPTVNNRGKHKFVEYFRQAAAPAPVGPLAQDSYTYTKAVAAVTQMFWKRVGGNEVQMTGPDPIKNPVSPTEFRAFTFLPGGLLLQYGWRSCATGVSTHVTFEKAFSAAPYSITTTLTKDAAGSAQASNVVDGSEAVNGFNIWINTTTSPHFVYWIAIGPQ